MTLIISKIMKKNLHFLTSLNSSEFAFETLMAHFLISTVDNWIVHEAIAAKYRTVIDGTDVMRLIHINHNYTSPADSHNHTRGSSATRAEPAQTFWQSNKRTNWQIFHNIELAEAYGSYQNQDGTTLHCPWKYVTCIESASGICSTRRLRPARCPCEHSSFARQTQSDPTYVTLNGGNGKTIVSCGSVSSDKASEYIIPVLPAMKVDQRHLGLPFTLQQVLSIAARDNHVVVTGATFNYRYIGLLAVLCVS